MIDHIDPTIGLPIAAALWLTWFICSWIEVKR